MTGIKKVAKLARVSHGTVSNVLQGNIYVSPEKVRRVKEAIKTLDYKQNYLASKLKSKSKKNIGIILPNLTDLNYCLIFNEIEHILSEKNYDLTLLTTADNSEVEKSAIATIIYSKCGGLIISTCQPTESKVFKNLVDSGIKLVLLEREIYGKKLFNCIQYDNYASIFEIVLENLKNGYSKIALFCGPEDFSNEFQCIKAYKDAFKMMNINFESDKIISTSLNKESSFIKTIDLLKTSNLDLIITTSTQLLEGVLSGIEIFKNKDFKKPKIYTLSEYTWCDNRYPEVLKIKRNSHKLGQLAAEGIISELEDIDNSSKKILNLKIDNYYEEKITNYKNKVSRTLKVLLVEGFAQNAIKKLLPNFEKHFNQKVMIDVLPYDALYREVNLVTASKKYDLFSIDIEWLVELVKQKRIYNLDELFLKDNSLVQSFSPDLIKIYSIYNNGYYSLPFIVDAQLLFYRRDLFEDIEIKSLYYKYYKKILSPPETWKEFETIGQFFTQEYNDKSPIKYGISLSNNSTLTAICAFLPRLWELNDKTFLDEKTLLLNKENCIKTLKEYRSSFSYASIESQKNGFLDQAEEFNKGNSAMAVTWYHSIVSNLKNLHPELFNKLGCTLIPGGQSLLGGWALSVNNKSDNKESAINFIRWIAKDVMVPYLLLEGSFVGFNFDKNIELSYLYPFLPMVYKSIHKSNKLQVNLDTTNGRLAQSDYKTIIGEMVFKAIKEGNFEECVNQANKRIKEKIATVK